MTLTARRPRPSSSRSRTARLLAGLEIATGVAAVVGGGLLVAAPDGHLMQADAAVLAGGPFTDWRLPGVLLATLVGGGYLLAGAWQLRNGPLARELSMAAGAGLVVFELAELAWIGFQPLEAVFAAVGATVLVLAVRQPRRETS
jgi:hypothetical protein